MLCPGCSKDVEVNWPNDDTVLATEISASYFLLFLSAEITTNFFSIHADIFSYAHAFYPNSSWHDIYRHSNSTLFLLLLDLTILQPVNQWPLQLKSDLQHFSLNECLQKKTLLPTLYDWRIDDNELASQSLKYRAYTLAGRKLKEELFYATT